MAQSWIMIQAWYRRRAWEDSSEREVGLGGNAIETEDKTGGDTTGTDTE